MDLKTRKLNLIVSLVQLEDENLISEIEALIENQAGIQSNGFKTFTKEELLERAAKSNEDSLAGRTISQEDLEKESENW